MGYQEIQLERDRHPEAAGLPPGRFGGDDDLAQHRRIEREGEHVRPAAYPAEARVQSPDLGVGHEREVQLAVGAPYGRERPRRGAEDPAAGDPDHALPVGQRDRPGDRQSALPLWAPSGPAAPGPRSFDPLGSNCAAAPRVAS